MDGAWMLCKMDGGAAEVPTDGAWMLRALSPKIYPNTYVTADHAVFEAS